MTIKITFSVNLSRMYEDLIEESELTEVIRIEAERIFRLQAGSDPNFQFNTCINFWDKGELIYDFCDEFCLAVIKDLCFDIPVQLLTAGRGEYWGASSNGQLDFVQQGDSVLMQDKYRNVNLSLFPTVEHSFPAKALITELHDCGTRMLDFYDEFWRLVLGKRHPWVAEYHDLQNETRQVLEKHNLI